MKKTLNYLLITGFIFLFISLLDTYFFIKNEIINVEISNASGSIEEEIIKNKVFRGFGIHLDSDYISKNVSVVDYDQKYFIVPLNNVNFIFKKNAGLFRQTTIKFIQNNEYKINKIALNKDYVFEKSKGSFFNSIQEKINNLIVHKAIKNKINALSLSKGKTVNYSNINEDGFFNYLECGSPQICSLEESFNNEYKIPASHKKVNIAVIDNTWKRSLDLTPKNVKINQEKMEGSESNLMNSHGEHVLGIIHSANPEANISFYPAYNIEKPDSLSSSKIFFSLLSVYLGDFQSLNLSFGGGNFNVFHFSLFFLLEKKGVSIIASAGNNSKNLSTHSCDYYPACYKKYFKNITVVGSISNNGLVSDFSNYGEMVDIYTNGENVLSYFEDRLERLSGTSMSAPLITGLLSQKNELKK